MGNNNFKPVYVTGYKGLTREGQELIVLEYKGRKEILIQLEDGSTKNATSTQIKQKTVVGVPAKRTYVGERFPTVQGEYAEVIHYKSNKEVEVRFKDGTTKTYSLTTLKSGDATSAVTRKPLRAGQVFPTNRYGDVEVVKQHSAVKVEIKFPDGTHHFATRCTLEKGNVGHPKSGVPEGFKFTNSQGVRGEVYCYHDPQSVDVKWEDGVVTFNHAAANIRKGALYYPNAKTVTDVGYFGIGDYIPDRNGRNGNYNKTVYRKWAHMIMRCYNPYEINKDSCRAYKDVEVCEEWKCFQNFAKWAEDHLPKFVDGFELDKDMFGTGYLYCPEYCVLLPDKVNGFLSNNYSNKSSGLPEGVNVIKPKTKNSKVGYCARCHVEGKRKYLGYYDTPEEAGEVYRLAKEAEAVRLAEEYKDLLTPVEYDKLRGFTLKDIHRK